LKRLILTQLIVIMSMIFFATPRTNADLLTMTPISYEISNDYMGGAFDIVSITPFNPALGTLDAVNVSISGLLAINGITGLSYSYGSMGTIVPQPFQYQITVTQDFFGLGGGLFEFNTPAEFYYGVYAPGYPSVPFAYQTSFTYDFSFDELTDNFWGFDIPTTTGATIPPLQVIGNRENFVDTFAFLGQLQILQTLMVTGAEPPISIAANVYGGFINIEYEYTPYQQTSPVPEPSTLLLLGSGMAGLAVLRKRFKA